MRRGTERSLSSEPRCRCASIILIGTLSIIVTTLTSMPCEHSAARSDASAPQTHQPIWIGRSPSRKSPGGATLLYVVPVDSSRSCSLFVVKNHHRDRSSQHHQPARVAEIACQSRRERSRDRPPYKRGQRAEGKGIEPSFPMGKPR
jgi:hypothetical protein